MRVFELARALGLNSKEVMDKARELGLSITNQLKALTPEEEASLRQALGSKAAPALRPLVQRKFTQKKPTAAPIVIEPAGGVRPAEPQPKIETVPSGVEAILPKAEPLPEVVVPTLTSQPAVPPKGEVPPVVVGPRVETPSPGVQPTAPPEAVASPPKTVAPKPRPIRAKPRPKPTPVVTPPPAPPTVKIEPPAAPPKPAVVSRPSGVQPEPLRPAPTKPVPPIPPRGIPPRPSPPRAPVSEEEAARPRKLPLKPGRGAAEKVREDWELEGHMPGGLAPPVPPAPVAKPYDTAAARRPTPVGASGERGESWGSRRRRGGAARRPSSLLGATPVAAPRDGKISVNLPVTVKELSATLGVKASVIISRLMQHGIMATINDPLSADAVELVGLDLGIEITTQESQPDVDLAQLAASAPDRPEDLRPRAPIVTFLGHVDHGKTTLLDAIREANVAAGETGGITQHIGAYRYKKGDREVTFLDTPGHETFTAMRARGANVTDVVVLVVAADDGVMPQTEEAIDHARTAGVPIVVAVNKIDKPEANPNRVRQQLAALGLVPEEWGGDTVFVNVSALTKQGVEELVEMLCLVAELRELKANPNKPASGTVLEAKVSPQLGPVATFLVRDGTLRRGDVVLCGTAYGRIRALRDDRGRSLAEAGPSQPVEVMGLSEPPEAGEHFLVVPDLLQARAIAESRRERKHKSALAVPAHVTLENLFERITKGTTRELRLVLKADVQGSLEALDKVIKDLSAGEVQVRVLRRGTGPVSLSDVLLADASDAVIVALHVSADSEARALAEQRGVDIREYGVIYHAVEEVRAALEGLLEPEVREEVRGHAEVRQVFNISRLGIVAGCYVTDGVILRSCRVRVLREGQVIHEGPLQSLRRFKEDVREVREGFECGIRVEGGDDIRVGDRLEAYEVTKVARRLPSNRSAAKPSKADEA